MKPDMDLAANKRPLVDQIADDLRRKITSGELAAGSRVPAEQELSASYDVSRDTVRRALTRLTQEGLLMVARGKGRLVRGHGRLPWWPQTFESRSSRRDHAGTEKDAWAADVAELGHDPSQDVQVMVIEAPPLVAERLQLQAGTSVVTRRRVRFLDGAPHQIADSFYPMDIATKPDSPIMQPGDVTIPGGLMKAAGHEQVRFVDEIVGRLADADERERLNLPPVTAIAEHVRTGYDVDDRPVRVIITVAERMTIMYESDGR